MKRVVMLLFCLVSVAIAQEENSNSNITKIDAYKVGFADGYERGKQEGIEEGFKQAVEHFKKVYEEKLQEYKEIEAGKILVKEWRVSFPKVYAIPTPDGSKVVVEGCKVIKPFDDLMDKIPLRSQQQQQQQQQQEAQKKLTVNVQSPGSYVKAKVPGKYSDKLFNTDAIVLKDTNSDMYTVYFKSDAEKNAFCSLAECF